MAIGSGLGSQLGLSVNEASYGTPTAPTKFYPARSFNVQLVQNTQDVSGVAAGRLSPPDDVVTTTAATGHAELDVLRVEFGRWLANLMGSTTSPVQQAATIAYLQTHAIGDNRGKFITMQESLPDAAGTANPMALTGGKVTSAEFSCGVDENLQASFDLDGRAIDQALALATASFPVNALPFHFAQSSVKLGTYNSEALVQGVRKTTVSIARGQDTGRFYSGNGGLKSEPIMNEMPAISGSFDADLVNKADFLDRFVANGSTSLVWEFVGANIASTYFYTFRIRLPKIKLRGGIPEVGGPDTLKGPVPFVAFQDPTNGLCQIEYMSTDTAI
jgi:hypothetical protein